MLDRRCGLGEAETAAPVSFAPPAAGQTVTPRIATASKNGKKGKEACI
ncbi:MAG: hypothetical protein IPO81_27060 [Kouleothrix sp.]|nr:hypothetical protein [Kouleothrix sp.]